MPGTGSRDSARAQAAARRSSRCRALQAHTFHKPDSAGSRCISCHMSDVNWRLLIRRRDHTFQPPVPENTAQFGVPERVHDVSRRSHAGVGGEADGRSGGATASGARKSVALADTMYRAGSGDATVLPALARLAVDRSQGCLVRASAVGFIEQLALGDGAAARRAPTRRARRRSARAARGASTSRAAASSRSPPSRRRSSTRLIGAACRSRSRSCARRRSARCGRPATASASLDADRRAARRPSRASCASRRPRCCCRFGIVELPGRGGRGAGASAGRIHRQPRRRFPTSPSNHAAMAGSKPSAATSCAARDALNKAIAGRAAATRFRGW